MMREDSGSATIITAFVLGALTGAAVALLVAPQTGDETRRLLSDKAREGADRAAEAARHGRELLNRQRENISSAIERGREAYEQARGTSPASPAPQGCEPL